ncbi:sulfurtransferase [Tepidimonas charontis]|uniref:Putative thiosulfate sulfurtransferase SseB n=1 Tax=Tepidimonas charontis TaxID=2267262 RepID=A0A554XL19_9BURK|nr:sulfurtransferase [Tepidimonas charontis]TSE36524.1 putative thiosulfate sulfurtransferase SseB [Tepidimonas charontis]
MSVANPAFPTTGLIDAATLRAALAAGAAWRVFDCSFDLADPAAGRVQYGHAHIPGAHYLHLDDDLSAGADAALCGGRHPLPTPAVMAQRLAAWGIGPDNPVVAYDRQGGMTSARLWWLLRWCGHTAVAVLDGGWNAWLASAGETESGDAPAAAPAPAYPVKPAALPLCSAADVSAALGRPKQTLVDARAPARYRGEQEPLDPVAGHIPGALNRPWTDNFTPDGRYKPAATLRAKWETLLAGRDPGSVVVYCGSGVSATPHVLAMTLAGWSPPALYAGSWSEWCADPARPCARSV